MRKTKHFFLALLAVTGLSTVWASDLPGSDPDSTAAKTSYTVQWTGTNDVTYNAAPQNVLSASYVDDNSTTHNLTLTFTNEDGSVVLTAPQYPKNAGAWTVTASTPQAGVTLTNATKTLNIHQAPVHVDNAAAEVAKFADGSLAGVTTDNGTLVGVLGNDPVGHKTTAIFSDAFVGTGKTITLHFALVGDDSVMLHNYVMTPSSKFYTNSGVVLPNIVPNNNIPSTDDVTPQSGIEFSAYGYCTGNTYNINYQLISGAPDQFSIDFDDSRLTDINWTFLPVAGSNGTLTITLPAVDMPMGDYSMNVYFRDSRFPALISNPFIADIHINLPQTYTMPLFDNVIALVDTCNCFTDIQWYHSTDGGANWTAIPGANGFFYREEGGLTGQYFVKAKMDGVETSTCPQSDMQTLISDASQSAKVAAYPNPTVDNVTISIDGSENPIHTFTVISTMGAEMMRGAFEGNTYTFDMSHFQHGSYMVNVDGNVVRVIKN